LTKPNLTFETPDEFMPAAHPVDIDTAKRIETDCNLKRYKGYPGAERLQATLDDLLRQYGADRFAEKEASPAEIKKRLKHAERLSQKLIDALNDLDRDSLSVLLRHGPHEDEPESLTMFGEEREALSRLHHRFEMACSTYEAKGKSGPRGHGPAVHNIVRQLLRLWLAWTGRKGWPWANITSETGDAAARFVRTVLELCDAELSRQQTIDLIVRELRLHDG
jgi:hypothetical protein